MEEMKIHPLLLHNLLWTTMYHYRDSVINDNSLLRSARMSSRTQVLNVAPASPKTAPTRDKNPKDYRHLALVVVVNR